jgi:hypothetical protein
MIRVPVRLSKRELSLAVKALQCLRPNEFPDAEPLRERLIKWLDWINAAPSESKEESDGQVQ